MRKEGGATSRGNLLDILENLGRHLFGEGHLTECGAYSRKYGWWKLAKVFKKTATVQELLAKMSTFLKVKRKVLILVSMLIILTES